MQGAAAAMEPDFSAQRRAMVDGQIRTFDVTDQLVVQAFSRLPRERFLPPELRSFAYSDANLTLRLANPPGGSRVLLRPMHLARMIQGASVQPTNRVLVVAGETGYAACLLAQMTAEVVTLETDPALTQAAAANARELGFEGVQAITGDLAKGLAERAPFDVILIEGAVEAGLDALLAQLAPDGRLIAIETMLREASRRAGRVLRFQRLGEDISERALFDAPAPVLPEFRKSEGFVF